MAASSAGTGAGTDSNHGGRVTQAVVEPLLTPSEVAALFRVDPKTVVRWAQAGRLSSIRTPGGHRRFREAEVMALLHGESPSGQTEASA